MTQDDIDHLRAEGYVVVRQLLPEATLDRIRTTIDAAVEKVAARWLRQGLIGESYPNEPFLTRWARIRDQLPSLTATGWRSVVMSQVMYELWRMPALTEIARAYLGDELWAHDIWTCRPREPHAPGQKIGWHQDAYYFRDWDPADGHALTCWITLVDATKQAGCLEVAPRSHLQGRLEQQEAEHGLVYVADSVVEKFLPQAVECMPGDVLVFTDLTAHRALPNESEYVRWSVDIRFTEDSPGFRTKSPGGFLCHTAGDPCELTSFEEWAGKYDKYTGVFAERYWSPRLCGDLVPEDVAREYDLYY